METYQMTMQKGGTVWKFRNINAQRIIIQKNKEKPIVKEKRIVTRFFDWLHRHKYQLVKQAH